MHLPVCTLNQITDFHVTTRRSPPPTPAWWERAIRVSHANAQNNVCPVFILLSTSCITFNLFFPQPQNPLSLLVVNSWPDVLSCFLATQTLSGQTDSANMDSAGVHPWKAFVSLFVFGKISWRTARAFCGLRKRCLKGFWKALSEQMIFKVQCHNSPTKKMLHCLFCFDVLEMPVIYWKSKLYHNASVPF